MTTSGSDADYGAAMKHERGQRKGPADSCDYEGCESTKFDLIRDRLTDERLVVCEECGFTMGWLE